MIPLALAFLGFFRKLRSNFKNPEFKALALVVLILLIIGTFFYNQVEGWSLFDSFYFCVITLATVGYGDFTPQTMLGKIFTIIYILMGVGTLLSFVTLLGHKSKEKSDMKNKG